jgi:hypothetical protein
MSAPTPPLVPQPFANDAGPGFINTIPDTTGSTSLASYQLGFPPLTFQPVASGGVPPQGQDFNGILNAVTQHLFALQGGQLQKYRADVSAALGGYALGALIAMADGAGYWINMLEGNTTNPDTGGANWTPVYAFGPTTKVVTGGVLTLTAPEAAREYLIFTGSLSGNQQVEVPARFGHWLVINACTLNGFTLTVKTAVGSGIEVPAGGAASPTAVYCDSVNVQRVFVPSALPTDVSPTPNTIVLRDNLGAQYALTAPLGTSTQQVASTQFVNPGTLLAATGYRKNPDGTIEQWGFNARLGSAAQTVAFPVAFSVACWSITATPVRTAGAALGQIPTVNGAPGLTTFQLAHSDGSTGAYWRAIGR